jgi:outer membrane protein assembly factor BamB
LAGAEQLLVATDLGLTSFDPTSGQVLWQHEWPTTKDQIARVTQPTVIGDRDVLIGTGLGVGMRRIRVELRSDAERSSAMPQGRSASSEARNSTPPGTWATEEIYTTRAIKPYFNDLVVYNSNAYGFDSAFFTCVGADDGQVRWRVRGYGSGQVLLLEDQGLLLITSEKGEVALVEANPARHVELARFQAIEGKTWNHPVVAHGKLFVRNGEEAAGFELAIEKSSP